jgi:parvulin-like peptidyl-prolyl isomerase
VESPKYALEIGDRKITPEQLSQAFSTRLGEFADHTEMDYVKSQMLDDLVAELLLDYAAQKAGVVANEEDVLTYLRGMESEKSKEGDGLQEEMRKSLRIQRYIKDILMKGYDPDPAALQKYFAEHQGEFLVPESVQVKEILVSSADQAERIMDLLKAGQNRNFSQLARQYSIAPTNSSGGDMGSFAKGDLPEEMEKVFFNMHIPGRVSPIIQTKYGYHIFMLVERAKEHQESFDEVKERIANRLMEERQKQVLADTIAQLRSTIPMVLYRQNLDFSYNGQEFTGGSNK